MKVYPNIVHAIIQGLSEIFHQNQQADKVVEIVLKSNAKWGSRDRRFIADNIYNVVRWYRLYYEILGQIPLNDKDWWGILGIQWILQNEDVSGIKEISHLNTQEIISKKLALSTIRKIKESFPDWLDEIAQLELGKDWDSIALALNLPQKVCLRVNTLKNNVESLKQELLKESIDTKVILPNTLILQKRAKLNHLNSFKNGFFEVQDYNSQLIAPFLDLKPNLKVVDACAGAGGKSLHLAQLMNNQGEIIALDIYEHKLSELKRRAIRAGINCIKTKHIFNNSVIDSLKNSADRLLLDVPCSGLGVLRRNPDAKWKLTPEFLNEIRETQQSILQNYSTILKTGGKMVYATCSILPSENQNQVERFLNSPNGENFKLIKQQIISPEENGFDGFYMALMEKSNL